MGKESFAQIVARNKFKAEKEMARLNISKKDFRAAVEWKKRQPWSGDDIQFTSARWWNERPSFWDHCYQILMTYVASVADSEKTEDEMKARGWI